MIKYDIDALDKIFKLQRDYIVENASNGWGEIRSEENFHFIEKDFDWGKRKIAVPKEIENNYKLQRSRGIGLNEYDSDETMLNTVKKELTEIRESDLVRIEELDQVLANSGLEKRKSFCEIGFRIPRLQNFYKKREMEESGYDINRFNVKLGKTLGYNCNFFDLSDEESKLSLKGVDLLVCYHVLEHVPDPSSAFKKIIDAVDTNCVLHIEIPVEPDGPRLKYGHLYPFHPYDMMKIIDISKKAKIIHASNSTHSDGPWIERYTIVKT